MKHLDKKALPKGEHMIEKPEAAPEAAPVDSKKKERFHRVMAEHYASGGEIASDMVRFGNKQDHLSGEENDSVELQDVPQGPDSDVVESQEEAPDLKKKMRLKSVFQSIRSK